MAVEQAALAAAWLRARSHTVRVPKPDAELSGLPELACDDDDFVSGLDLAVALGGDGTMLRAVERVSPAGVPVLGVNLGYLGFLTAVEPSGMTGALEAFLDGRHLVEERMMLDASSGIEGGHTAHARALNEVVVEKQGPGRTVHLEVSIGGTPWTTYVADGMIVASPTGSTAYSFSVRGPVLSPDVRAMVVTPVSPHMPFDRTLVVGPDDAVRIKVVDDRPAMLSIDGQEMSVLAPGSVVTVTGSSVPARLVTLGRRDFFAVVKAKFGVGR